jgi:hypothetical protein
MPMVTAMLNEWDPELTRAFAQAREPLADGAFTAALLSRIERARRLRLWRQILTIAAVLGLAAFNIRLVLETTAGAMRYVSEVSPASADFLITPWGWAASMLIGAWIVLRARPSRR